MQIAAGPKPKGSISSDASRTARRCVELDAYLGSHVLDGDRFICPSADACRSSHGGAFYEAQAHHVGRHFDLAFDGRPMRVVVTGQEYGGPPAHVSRTLRENMIVEWSGTHRRFVRDAEHTARNPHMRGTTSLLRLFFGSGLGTDYDGEFIDVGEERVHLFECFALVNFLLCSAVAGPPRQWIEGISKGGVQGRSTTTMQRNCAEHYRRVLEILDPTVLVAQGKGVRYWMRRVIDQAEALDPRSPVERVRIGGTTCLLLTLAHPASPSRDNWGMNERQPYLLTTVVPAVAAVLAETARGGTGRSLT